MNVTFQSFVILMIIVKISKIRKVPDVLLWVIRFNPVKIQTVERKFSTMYLRYIMAA